MTTDGPEAARHEDGQGAVERHWRTLQEAGPLVLRAGATVGLFVVAVQLLGAATDAAAPLIRRWLPALLAGDAGALGASWLVTYGLTNGSVVAALGISLLDSGVLAPREAFLVVAGSRLGAGAVVVLIGALDYGQKHSGRTLREGTSLGLLTFLVTLAIYVPVTVVGALALPASGATLARVAEGLQLSGQPLAPLERAADAVATLLGPLATLLLAVGLLFASLRLFDRVLQDVDVDSLRHRVFRHFEHRWTAFAVGLVVTAATTSVAFSLGVVVPLYNRGYVERREILPYIMGANVGTLLDTLVVALVLDTTEGVAMMLLLLGLATAVTLLALVVYDPFARGIDGAQDALLADPRLFVAFGVVLVAVPLGLLAVQYA